MQVKTNASLRVADLTIFFLLFGLIYSSVAALGSSIIRTDLASVQQVRVHIATGAFYVAEIPGFESEQFKRKLYKRSIEALFRHGVQESDTSPLILIINFDLEKTDSGVAANVVIELTEPVTAHRENVWLGNEPYRATTFNWSHLVHVPEHELAETLIKWTFRGADRFAEEVKQGRHYVESNLEP